MSYTRFASGDALDDWYIYWDCLSGPTKESQVLSVWASTKVLAERGADPDGLFMLTWEELDEVMPHCECLGLIPGWPLADGPERQALIKILREWHFEARANFEWWCRVYGAWSWITRKWWWLKVHTWGRRAWEREVDAMMARLQERYPVSGGG